MFNFFCFQGSMPVKIWLPALRFLKLSVIFLILIQQVRLSKNAKKILLNLATFYKKVPM